MAPVKVSQPLSDKDVEKIKRAMWLECKKIRNGTGEEWRSNVIHNVGKQFTGVNTNVYHAMMKVVMEKPDNDNIDYKSM
jgi:hypothetical protein